MSAPTIQYTHTEDGIAIAWAERGEGTPLIVSTGPMMPLGVGWEDGGVWDRLARSYRVVRFDPRGCGLSERDGVFGSFHDEAMDLAAVMSALGAPRAALMGFYIGTPAAVIALLNEPERFTHLVLHLPVPMAGHNPLQGQDDAQRELSALMDSTIDNLLRLGWVHHEEAARRALLTILAPMANELTLRSLAKSMHNYASPNRLFGLLPEMRSLDLKSELREIDVPTLISIPSEGDTHEYNAASYGREWAQLIRGAKLVMAHEDATVLVDDSPAIAQLAESMEDFIGVYEGPQTVGQATRTILFTDIEESTSLVNRLGDAKAREITREIERLTQRIIQAHEGVQLKTMGDGVMAWFAAAASAVDAAVAIQQQVSARGDDTIRVRIGISAGEPIAESRDLYGQTVNQASRIMGKAAGGEIIVSHLVRGLLQGRQVAMDDLGMHELRGFSEPVQLFKVDWQAAGRVGEGDSG